MKNNNERSYLAFQVEGYSPAITDAGKIGITNFYQRNGLSISVPYTILGTAATLDDATLIVSNYINKEVLSLKLDLRLDIQIKIYKTMFKYSWLNHYRSYGKSSKCIRRMYSSKYLLIRKRYKIIKVSLKA